MDPRTPRLTRHARQRCAELGIGTKRVKRIVRHPSSTYPSQRGHDNNGVVLISALDPDYAVVVDLTANVVLTVLPRVLDEYVRTADGFRLAAKRENVA